MTGSVLPVAASLVAIVILILGLGFVLRRLPGGGRAGSALRIHGALAVGARERVLWIEAGGKHLLIGVSAGSVRTLHEFAEPPPHAVAAQVPPFSELLQRAWGGGAGP